MPKATPLDPKLPERAKERERARKLKRLRPGQGVKIERLLENIVERLEAIERILGIGS